jgi:mycothiol synthase
LEIAAGLACKARVLLFRAAPLGTISPVTDPPVQVEPVPPAAVAETLRFVVGGTRRDIPVALRAEAYERMIRHCGGRYGLWWARRDGRCVAASLVVAGAGGVGMQFHCPPQAPGVEAGSIPPVIRRASARALEEGISFVQTLVQSARHADAGLLEAGGFERLAELVYMNLDLGGPIQPEGLVGCRWRNYEQYDESELSAVIRGTYEQSLDCPALYGLRTLPQVIEGHKASGVFSPQSWWILDVAGRPAGCVLVNDSPSAAGDADLVYLGVVGYARGRGLGRAMVRHAARWAQQQRRVFMSVAVDSSNVYAMRIYDSEGFRQTDRRMAYILSPQRWASIRGV